MHGYLRQPSRGVYHLVMLAYLSKSDMTDHDMITLKLPGA